jgi:hypothetical protein
VFPKYFCQNEEFLIRDTSRNSSVGSRSSFYDLPGILPASSPGSPTVSKKYLIDSKRLERDLPFVVEPPAVSCQKRRPAIMFIAVHLWFQCYFGQPIFALRTRENREKRKK